MHYRGQQMVNHAVRAHMQAGYQSKGCWCSCSWSLTTAAAVRPPLMKMVLQMRADCLQKMSSWPEAGPDGRMLLHVDMAKRCNVALIRE